MICRKVVIISALCLIFTGCYTEELSIHEDMVLIEGGEFTLGGEFSSGNVRVRLDTYYVSRYETTVEQWEIFLKQTDTPYQWKGEYIDMRKKSPSPDSPIGVGWKFAILYANWVSRKYDLDECYAVNGDDVHWKKEASGYRLLTDAE